MYLERMPEKFTSKKVMWQHLQVHGPDTWKCDKCNKTFETKSNFRQHDRGLHGIGWRALCGQLCQWPYLRARHQRKCDKCQEIKAERDNKPDNLRKFRRQNTDKLKKKEEKKSDSEQSETEKNEKADSTNEKTDKASD